MELSSQGADPQLIFTIRDVPVVVPCFGISLFTHKLLSHSGQALVDAFERFGSLVPHSELRWYRTETMGARKPTSSKTMRLLPTWLRPGAPRREYLALEMTAGEGPWASSDLKFEVFGQEQSSPTLDLPDANYVHVTFPLGWMKDKLFELEAQARSLFESMPFVSGSAGPMLVQCPFYRMESQRFGWPTVMRYRGFDYADLQSDAFAVRGDGLRSVNWLTFVGSGLVEELGGVTAIGQRLSKAVQLNELPNGLCLKAGARPALGDWAAAERLVDYESVFHACEPLIDRAAQRCSPMQLGRDEKERTIQLIRRLAYEGA